MSTNRMFYVFFMSASFYYSEDFDQTAIIFMIFNHCYLVTGHDSKFSDTWFSSTHKTCPRHSFLWPKTLTYNYFLTLLPSFSFTECYPLHRDQKTNFSTFHFIICCYIFLYFWLLITVSPVTSKLKLNNHISVGINALTCQ